jgi:hypothetical protein
MHKHIHACMHTYIHADMNTGYLHTPWRARMHEYICMYVCLYINMCMYIHAHIYTCTYTYIYTYIHADMNTGYLHTPWRAHIHLRYIFCVIVCLCVMCVYTYILYMYVCMKMKIHTHITSDFAANLTYTRKHTHIFAYRHTRIHTYTEHFRPRGGIAANLRSCRIW